MLMLDHAKEVTREQLADFPTPLGTRTWRPQPHHEVVAALINRAETRGLRIQSERYAVRDGAIHPRKGERIPVEAAKLFASFDFAPIEGIPFPPDCQPSMGVRNSNDQSFALSILAGSRVVVCANGLLLAEHVINRKHTSGLTLVDEIDKALGSFMQTLLGFQETYEHLRNQRLATPRAHHLIVELAREGAFPPSDILKVVHEWEEPRHAEFREATLWSLHQACTETMKHLSPARQVEGMKALSRVLLPLAN